MNISVIVPVFNGEKTIDELFQRIKLTLESYYTFEVVLVHDGGNIESWQKICDIKSTNSNLVKAIRLEKNYGQHVAILCGIKYASGDLIITMDQDLQHAPEEIQKLINCQKLKDSDLVYGYYEKPKHSRLRNIASLLLKSILLRRIKGLHRDYTSFRLVKLGPAKSIAKMRCFYPFIDGSFASLSLRVDSVLVSHFRSSKGISSYSVIKLLKHTIFILLAYTKYPNIWNKRGSLFLLSFFIFFGGYFFLSRFIIIEPMNKFLYGILSVTLGIGVILFLIRKISVKNKKELAIDYREPNYIKDKII